jgi:uncharacterized protein (TIGR04141 family)
VLSYGKSHFYIRSHCDFDFGIELAKRIADEWEIKQTASRRFQGKKRKDIKSYASNTRLDVESGESVDYVQGAVVSAHRNVFGKAGKFGTSALLSVDISPGDLGDFMDAIDAVLHQAPMFKLPRTVRIADEGEVERYDKLLIAELMSSKGGSDFVHNSYDLYGVDFVFSGGGSFILKCRGYPDRALEALGIDELRSYIRDCSIAPGDVLRIKVVHQDEERPAYAEGLKHALDFIADDDRVLLTNGRWMRFNQDYLEFLDEYLSGINVEEVEPEFSQISIGEPEFNECQLLRDHGYELADKNFDIFKTRRSTPVEAWDLKKGKCVYAVKFGTAQKLGYVCDQATGLLEMLRNRAGVRRVPEFEKYCLWLGYKSKGGLDNIADSGSIILKQKIETWARKARELGIEPVLKLSQKV